MNKISYWETRLTEMGKKAMRGGVYVPESYEEWLGIVAKELNSKVRHHELPTPDAFWNFIREKKVIYNYMIEDRAARTEQMNRKGSLDDDL